MPRRSNSAIKEAEKVEVKNQDAETIEVKDPVIQDEPIKDNVPIVPNRAIANRGNDTQALISLGLEKNVDINTMKELFAMHKEIMAASAKEDFFRDFAEFQNECPIITKNKKAGKDNSFSYEYATLDNIISHVQPFLTKWGFSFTFQTENDDKTMACAVHHKGGHTEYARFPIAIDSSGRMNAIQKIGSARSYAKRYALCDALGIATADGDDDAQSTGDDEPTYSQPQKAQPKQPVNQGPQKEPEPTTTADDEYKTILDAFFLANNTNEEQKKAIIEAVEAKKDPAKRKAFIQAIINKTETKNTLDTLINSLKVEFRGDWIEEKDRCKTTEDYQNAIELLRDHIFHNPGQTESTKLEAKKTTPLPGQKPAEKPKQQNAVYADDEFKDVDLF